MALILLCPLILCSPGDDAQPTVAPAATRMLDLDGDGHLDKLYLGVDGSLRVALHSGARRFDEVPQELPRVIVSNVLVTDLDCDGSLDLLLISPGANVALRGDGMGRFTVATDRLGLEDAGDGLSAERMDLDEDGHEDLLLHNRTLDVVYWAKGDGTFERDGEAMPAQTGPGAPVLVLGAALADASAPNPDDVVPAAPTTAATGGGTRRPVLLGNRASPGSEAPVPQVRIPASLVEGTGTPGTLPKWIGSRKLGNSVLVESAGKLGIGTASPAAKLDVAGGVAVNGGQVIDGSGQWVGDPTGLIGPPGATGPAGPTGPPGVVSFATDNTRGGTNALLSNTSGSRNTAFGVDALRYNTTGYDNTASGKDALRSNTTGSHNTASGRQALRDNTTGFFNAALGTYALLSNTTGSSNVASGWGALALNTTGHSNVASGSRSLYLNTTGSYNTASGANSLTYNTTGSYNTASGNGALYFNTTGSHNTASGLRALRNNTTGFFNAASGAYALQSNTTGSSNVASGFGALALNTTGSSNVASGSRALYLNTIGGYNTASGANTLTYNTTGSYNTASGNSALYFNTTGSYNTASGLRALRDNTTGFFNAAFGAYALFYNTTGSQNTASGFGALALNTTGYGNVAAGSSALYLNTTGINGTAVGSGALRYNSTGSGNIAIGRYAGSNIVLSDNIAIGNSGAGADSGVIRIGTSPTHARSFFAGIRGVTTANANAIPVLIDSAGQLGTISSSRRFKEDIVDMGDATDRLLDLRAVLFRYRSRNTNGDGPFEFGLIAEEVAEIFPELVVYDEEGEPFTVRYHLLGTMLLNELQKENERNEAQASEIETQSIEIAELTSGLEAMGERITALEQRE